MHGNVRDGWLPSTVRIGRSSSSRSRDCKEINDTIERDNASSSSISKAAKSDSRSALGSYVETDIGSSSEEIQIGEVNASSLTRLIFGQLVVDETKKP